VNRAQGTVAAPTVAAVLVKNVRLVILATSELTLRINLRTSQSNI